MKHIVFSGVLTCWLVVGMAACAAPRNDGSARETAPTAAVRPAVVLQTGRHCTSASDGWKATWISSHRALRAKVAQCGANRIGAETDSLPEIEYTRHGVLVVEMGRRSTGGYGFDTEDVTVRISGRTAIVELGIHQPAPGAPVTQALTAPWIMIRMPLGEYRNIRVVNRNARLLTEIKLP